MTNLSKFIALFIIATIPIPFAAVQPWVWSFYSLLMIVAYVFSIWTTPSASNAGNRRQQIAVGVFFLWTLALCIPLPPPILTFLSPVRSAMLSETGNLIGGMATSQALSYSSREALTWWVFLLSLSLFFYLTRNLCCERKTIRRIVAIMIVIGIAEAIYGMIQALVPSMGVLWVDYVQAYMGNARGTFINRNHFAGFLEMIWPLALGLTLSMTGRVHSPKMILHSDRLNRQALMALCIIVFLLALILTRSRAGIISGIAGCLVFFLMARPAMGKRSRQIQIILGGIVALLAVYATSIGIGPVIDRFFTIGTDGGSRLSIWRDSLLIIRDHPLGIGLHNYGNVIEAYNRTGTIEKTIGHAHNDYLQLLIESGWIGFLALTGAILTFLARSARRIRRLDFRRDPLRFYLAVGAFSGLVSIGVHSFFDFNLQIPANCVYVTVIMAILSACTRPRSGPLRPPSLKPETAGGDKRMLNHRAATRSEI